MVDAYSKEYFVKNLKTSPQEKEDCDNSNQIKKFEDQNLSLEGRIFFFIIYKIIYIIF